MRRPPDIDCLHASIDTETTGLDLDRDRIRSIGLVCGTIRYGIVHRLALLVDTAGQPSAPDAMAVHKIPDNLGGGLPLHAALAVLERIRLRAPVIMHNRHFDALMLIAAHKACNLALPDYLANIDTIADTMDVARSHFPGCATNLNALAKAANIGTDPIAQRSKRHDVLDDAILTFELWRKTALPTTLAIDIVAPSAKAKTETSEEPANAGSGLDWLA